MCQIVIISFCFLLTLPIVCFLEMSVTFKLPKNIFSFFSDMSYHRIENEDDTLSIDRYRSVILPILQEEEKTFFSLVASGNVEAVATFLDKNEEFNVNCCNFQVS